MRAAGSAPPPSATPSIATGCPSGATIRACRTRGPCGCASTSSRHGSSRPAKARGSRTHPPPLAVVRRVRVPVFEPHGFTPSGSRLCPVSWTKCPRRCQPPEPRRFPKVSSAVPASDQPPPATPPSPLSGPLQRPDYGWLALGSELSGAAPSTSGSEEPSGVQGVGGGSATE